MKIVSMKDFDRSVKSSDIWAGIAAGAIVALVLYFAIGIGVGA